MPLLTILQYSHSHHDEDCVAQAFAVVKALYCSAPGASPTSFPTPLLQSDSNHSGLLAVPWMLLVCPCSKSLHWLIPLPGIVLPQTSVWLTSSRALDHGSHATFSAMLSLSILFRMATLTPSSLQHSLYPCPYFIFLLSIYTTYSLFYLFILRLSQQNRSSRRSEGCDSFVDCTQGRLSRNSVSVCQKNDFLSSYLIQHHAYCRYLKWTQLIC